MSAIWAPVIATLRASHLTGDIRVEAGAVAVLLGGQAALAKLKQVGDIAAHNPRVNLVRGDIDGIALGIRVAMEELLRVAKLK